MIGSKTHNLARIKDERDAYQSCWRGQPLQDKRYTLQSPSEDEDEDGDDLDDLPCTTALSSMGRDGHSCPKNGQYSSMQISNGGAGSAVSSPAEEIPEPLMYAPSSFQVANNGSSHFGMDSQLRKPPVRYHECQKNHAASIGGNAIDGCGEFLPGGKEGTLEALKCAACNCHRNFHRREFVTNDNCVCGASESSQARLLPPYLLSQSARSISPGVHETKDIHQPLLSTNISPRAYAGLPITQLEEDDDDYDEPPPQHPRTGSSKNERKRFRTKFTPEQKERMFYFAETLGWRISKHDEEAVDTFCQEVGLKRNVFKVYMHNNRHNPRKKQSRGSVLDRSCDSSPDYCRL